MAYSLQKKERIKSKKLMEKAFSEGNSITAFPFKLLYVPAIFEEEVFCKVAVVAPKKNFKQAVQRNRIKRLLREAYRTNKPQTFNNTERQYALVILYLGKEMPSFAQVEQRVKGLLKKFIKIIQDEKNP